MHFFFHGPPRPRPICILSSKTLTEMGRNTKAKPKRCIFLSAFRPPRTPLAIWDPVLQKIWTWIKGFVSLGWKTFHHFFLLAWKYNTNYFTRKSEKCLKNNFAPCQRLLFRSVSVLICSRLSKLFLFSLGTFSLCEYQGGASVAQTNSKYINLIHGGDALENQFSCGLSKTLLPVMHVDQRKDLPTGGAQAALGLGSPKMGGHHAFSLIMK